MGVGDVVSAFEAVCPLSGCFEWTKGTIGTCGNGFGEVYKCLCFMLKRGWCVPFVKCRRHALVFCYASHSQDRQALSVSALRARVDSPLASPRPVCGVLSLVDGLPDAIQLWYRVRRVLSGMWCCLASFLMPPSSSRTLKRSNQLNEAWA